MDEKNKQMSEGSAEFLFFIAFHLSSSISVSHCRVGFFVGQVQTCREQPHLAAVSPQDAAYSEAVSGWLARGTAAKGTQSADCRMKHRSVWREGFLTFTLSDPFGLAAHLVLPGFTEASERFCQRLPLLLHQPFILQTLMDVSSPSLSSPCQLGEPAATGATTIRAGGSAGSTGGTAIGRGAITVAVQARATPTATSEPK